MFFRLIFDMRFLLLFIVCCVCVVSFAQITPSATDGDFKETQKVHPSLRLKHALGLNVKEYLGFGISYRYRSIRGLGVQVSYSPETGYNPTRQAVEIAGLYTLAAGTTDWVILRMFKMRDKVDYNFYVYQSNIWLTYGEDSQIIHSINIGVETIYWRKISTNVSLGYIIAPKVDFRMSISFGVYYRF